jgi:two-component system LytT family response regulator
MIIDDEKIARDHMRELLAPYGTEIQIIGEASNGPEAVDKIVSLSPDLIFLDVQMPGLNGFEVVRRLENPPLVVFVTAFDEYALEAFRVSAVDYLLKPVSNRDLSVSLQKLTRYAKEDPADIHSVVESIIAGMKSDRMTRIKVSVGDTIKFVPVEKVMYFEADEKYTTLYSEEGAYIIESTLADLETRLPSGDFIRIHRKHIVNMNYILEIKKWFDRKLRLKIRGCEKKEFIVSRNYSDRIRTM